MPESLSFGAKRKIRTRQGLAGGGQFQYFFHVTGHSTRKRPRVSSPFSAAKQIEILARRDRRSF